MNIAIFASAFHPSLGGVEELCRQLSHANRAAGHEVSIWTNRWPRTLPAYELYEGIPVHRFALRVPLPRWKPRLSFALTHHLIRSQIVRELRQTGAELLHVQCVSSTAMYALHAQRTLGLPLIVTLQGELNMDAEGAYQKPGIGQEIMRAALARADLLTGCSRQTLEEAEHFFGQPFQQPTKVIYNGVSLQEFADADAYFHPKPYVFALGRHVREKGFDLLLQAFDLVADGAHDLLIAGDGLEHANLQAQAAALSHPERVKFLGRVEHAKAVSLFKGCSFFVLPSRHEPFGMVNLEAMAAGKAVVATKVGGVPEIVSEGQNGLLVPAGDAPALGQALRRLMADGALRDRLGAGGAGFAQRFDWNDLAAQYRQLYEKVLPGGACAPGNLVP